MADDVAAARPGLKLDTTVSHSARIWNYWLGGKDHYAVDREAGDKVAAMLPSIVTQARADRAFLGRAITYLAGEEGIRQFLDIGTGLPTADNTHEVAQRIAPQSRIVYADNDPLVLAHARALLTSSPQGTCDYIDGDLRDPDGILAKAAHTLDFTQPVALMLLAIMQFIPDEEDPAGLVSTLLKALPSGSYLVLSHPTDDFNPNQQGESIKRYNERVTDPATLRDHEGTMRFFAGLELLEPGVVGVSQWRPDSDLTAAMPSSMWCGVGRKP